MILIDGVSITNSNIVDYVKKSKLNRFFGCQFFLSYFIPYENTNEYLYYNNKTILKGGIA